MKIIEALKELPLIKKKIDKNIQLITEYSSYVTGLSLAFETEDKQKETVQSLIQSNKDLARRFETLTNGLSKTNSSVMIEIEGTKKTIREWITFRNVTSMQLKTTYSALSNLAADKILRESQGKINLENGIQVKRLYKEEDKLFNLNAIQAMVDKIDATLEIVNVNTDLQE